MNNRRFLFVSCVNDEELYESCVRHIKRLIIPPGYEIDTLAVRNVKSITEGYNRALKDPAKYKIYLHQDVFIINPYFLHNILFLFQSNPRLGMIGLAGCKSLPPNGIWWDGEDLIGKAIAYPDQTFALMKLREVEGHFESVEAVDGFLIATQYDLPWREDIIDGFHFYDTSQSLEFIKKGYLVGVPKQVEPWCLHYHVHHQPDPNEYQRLQSQFLKYGWMEKVRE